MNIKSLRLALERRQPGVPNRGGLQRQSVVRAQPRAKAGRRQRPTRPRVSTNPRALRQRHQDLCAVRNRRHETAPARATPLGAAAPRTTRSRGFDREKPDWSSARHRRPCPNTTNHRISDLQPWFHLDHATRLNQVELGGAVAVLPPRGEPGRAGRLPGSLTRSGRHATPRRKEHGRAHGLLISPTRSRQHCAERAAKRS